MLDIDRIAELQTETTKLKQSTELLSIESWGVHLTQKGLLQVEPDKSLWIIEEQDCPNYSYQASVHLHGVKWFTIGSKEEFE